MGKTVGDTSYNLVDAARKAQEKPSVKRMTDEVQSRRHKASDSTIIGGTIVKRWGALLGFLGAIIVVVTAVAAVATWSMSKLEDYVSTRIDSEQSREELDRKWAAVSAQVEATDEKAKANEKRIEANTQMLQRIQRERAEADRMLLERVEALFDHYHPRVRTDPPKREKDLDRLLNVPSTQ